MAKTKQIIRSSIKSFFEKHADPEKHVKLEATRKDMEEKKNQILNLVQNEEEKDETKRGTLSELIEDFHKQYESLYAQYDHLTGELKNKVHKRHHENGDSSSSSDSDSDSSSDSDNSLKKKSIRKGKLRGETLKATDGLKQELEAAKDEVAVLKNKFESAERAITDSKVETKTLNSEKSDLLAEKEHLSSKLEEFVQIEVDLKQELEAAKAEVALLKEKLEDVSDEKEALQSANDAMIRKLENAERAITDLKVETETLNSETSNLLAEKEDLNSKLEGFVKIEVDLKQQIDELIREKEGAMNLKAEEQINALKEQNDSLKLELEIVMREKRETEEQFESTGTDAGKMGEELSELRAKICSLQNLLEVNENDSNAKIEALTARVNDFTEEVDKLHAEKSRLEEQMNELEGNLRESRANLETAGSEIERLTQQVPVASESTDESIVQLKRTIEDLKRAVAVAEDEAKNAVKKTCTVEFQVLMAKQKLRITEQLLAEKEEDYKMAVTKFQEECKILEDKNASLSIALAANDEVYRGMIKNMSENMNRSISGLECITKKFEEDNERLSGRIYSMSEEIQSLKHCVPGKSIGQQNLEERIRNLTEELRYEREQGLIVQENLSKLQVEVGKEKGEKERLLEALTELKKTTQEQVAILEHEKREAIRQMCLWSDNLQTRYNELKDMVVKSYTTKTVV